LTEFFNQYANEEKSAITVEGITRFCSDLNIDPVSDITILVIVWKCDCKIYGTITKAEFIHGMKALHADSVASLNQRLEQYRNISQQTGSKGFKDFFKWVFQFNCEHPSTVLDIEVACALLPMLLASAFPITSKLVEFMQTKDLKAMNMDQWTSWMEVCKETEGDFVNNYDEDGSWPLLIDEFYYWLKEGN
jgi:DCN1-like protein 1/2